MSDLTDRMLNAPTEDRDVVDALLREAAARITELEADLEFERSRCARLAGAADERDEARAQIAAALAVDHTEWEPEKVINGMRRALLGRTVTHPEPEPDASHVDDEDPNVPEVIPWHELRESAGVPVVVPEPEGQWSKSRAFAADEVLAGVPEFVDPKPWLSSFNGSRSGIDLSQYNGGLWVFSPRSAAEYEADRNR